MGLGVGQCELVIPTAMAMIAVDGGRRLGLIRGREVERRIALGCSMLWDRMCPGGGWNAGNSVVYGVPLPPMWKQHPSPCLRCRGISMGPKRIDRCAGFWRPTADQRTAWLGKFWRFKHI
jgi:hypothetical protein